MKKLWRRLFPVKEIYVLPYKKPDTTVSKDKSELWPEVAKAYQKCPELFTWFYDRLAELEVLYHRKPDNLTAEGMAAYSTERYGLINRIDELKRVIKLPSYSVMMLNKKDVDEKALKNDDYTNWG